MDRERETDRESQRGLIAGDSKLWGRMGETDMARERESSAREREREREKEKRKKSRQTERERKRERESVYVCVCMKERERKRECVCVCVCVCLCQVGGVKSPCVCVCVVGLTISGQQELGSILLGQPADLVNLLLDLQALQVFKMSVCAP